MSSLVRAPVPPRIVLHAANVLRATEIPKWGHDTAIVQWHPRGGRGRPARRGALQTWGAGIRRHPVPAGRHPGALAPHAPHRPCTDGCEGLRVGWEAVADGTLLALLHRDAANGCQWDTLAPHLTRRHVYMATPAPPSPYTLSPPVLASSHHSTTRERHGSIHYTSLQPHAKGLPTTRPVQPTAPPFTQPADEPRHNTKTTYSRALALHPAPSLRPPTKAT